MYDLNMHHPVWDGEGSVFAELKATNRCQLSVSEVLY